MSSTHSDGKSLSGTELWRDGKTETKKLKGKISRHTLVHQDYHCAYCECLLSGGCAEIEHFAPKESYREFTFEPLNIMTACKRCNSPKIKGKQKTIDGDANPNYTENNFTIVHPYLCNDPDKEIVFTDNTRTTFDKDKCTELGKDTIAFFHWDDEDARLTRLKEAAIRGLAYDKKKLLMEIAVYQ